MQLMLMIVSILFVSSSSAIFTGFSWMILAVRVVAVFGCIARRGGSDFAGRFRIRLILVLVIFREFIFGVMLFFLIFRNRLL